MPFKNQKYSVLMSVYYKENPLWLEQSIESMLHQTILCDEFVIVKDGVLTDELDSVLEKYKNKYSDLFHIVALEKNQGLGIALQIGVKNCQNEFIARMDSDDYSSPDRMEKELAIFNKYPELDIVGTNVSEFIDNPDNVISKVILPEKQEEIVCFSKKRNPFRHPSVVFKKQAVLKAGNYREYYLCEDYDLWVRMIRSGCLCYNVQEVLVYMRINADFYKRRGGLLYFKSIHKFKKEQLDNGYFTKLQYIKTIVPHAIVCFMPNFCRDFIYKNYLRKK